MDTQRSHYIARMFLKERKKTHTHAHKNEEDIRKRRAEYLLLLKTLDAARFLKLPKHFRFYSISNESLDIHRSHSKQN